MSLMNTLRDEVMSEFNWNAERMAMRIVVWRITSVVLIILLVIAAAIIVKIDMIGV